MPPASSTQPNPRHSNHLVSSLTPAVPGLPPTQLQVGMNATVSSANAAGNALHRAPETAATVLAQAAPGSRTAIIGGPMCKGEQRWWRVMLTDGPARLDGGWRLGRALAERGALNLASELVMAFQLCYYLHHPAALCPKGAQIGARRQQ